MRDNFNFNMLPIVQDNINHVPGVRSLTNVSSNGYYGYQPPLLDKDKEAEPHTYAMEVQFECKTGSRKRAWDLTNDFPEFKKRRQNEKVSANAPKKKADPSEDSLLEDLLKGTHGCALYHWNSDGL